MALLTDGTLAGIHDLTQIDSGLLDIAKTEGIDLLQKLDLARQEITYLVSQVLDDPSTQVSGVVITGFYATDKVVVDARLQRWHALETLSQVYRDLFHSQLNDRYGKRWEQYRLLSETASIDYLHGGIPVVGDPIPRPLSPDVIVTAGTLSATTYYLAVSLTRNGKEGEASEVTALSAPDGHSLEVKAPTPSGNSTGWNLYAGLTAQSLGLQSQAPQTTDAQIVATTLSTEGRKPSCGQAAETKIRPNRRLRRG